MELRYDGFVGCFVWGDPWKVWVRVYFDPTTPVQEALYHQEDAKTLRVV